MEYYVTQSKDYWIAPTAVNITLNALGEKNRIQGSVASGAVIMCFIEDIKAESAGGEPGNGDGLWYGSNHEPKRWPLSLSPTFFNSDTRKYVYAAIPREVATGSQAIIVFPSEELDIYGRARRLQGEEESYIQIGSTDYFYVFLQGIIGVPQLNPETNRAERGWEVEITDWGKLSTAQGIDEKLNSSEWYSYSQVDQVVTFLKEIVMREGSNFRNIFLNHKNLTDVATSIAAAPIDSDTMVATPNYISKFYLSKVANDVAEGHITFQQGLQSVLAATFGTYNREAGTTPTGAAILPNGTGDFIDLIVKGMVRGNLTVEELLTAKDIVFNRMLKSSGAREGFMDGTGIIMKASDGTVQADGGEFRGFLKVMELIINRLQLMEADYSFTEGDTTERVDWASNGQRMVLTMHKEHDNDHTPFYPGDILYAKINDLQDHGTYYTCWVQVISVDLTNNTITVKPYNGVKPDASAKVPGGKNFTFLGTEITTDFTVALATDYAANPDGYEKIINLTRHGNVADGLSNGDDPSTYDVHVLESQKARQQAWVLSTSDKRLSFFWNVDEPILKDENYAVCLGILPDLANLPVTRNPNMPSLYINTLFADNIEQANYPARVVKTDRGQWQANPTAIYDGEDSGTWVPDGSTIVDGSKTYGLYVQQLALTGGKGIDSPVAPGDTINEPYHCRTFTKSDWFSRRLSPSWRTRNDATMEKMMLVQSPKADLEVSRVWKGGKLWECLVDGTTQEPALGCTDWQCISGDMNFYIEFQSTNGNSFYQGHVSTVVTARLWWGTEDVTSQVGVLSFSWTRSSESGKTDADRAWDAQEEHSGTNVLSLSDSDMPTAWSRNNKAIFTCTVRYNNEVVAENEVIA